MPYKDPQKKLNKMKEWRKAKMSQGYGKALYARRAHRYRNEEILRAAVVDALAYLEAGETKEAISTLLAALAAAPEIGKPIDYMP